MGEICLKVPTGGGLQENRDRFKKVSVKKSACWSVVFKVSSLPISLSFGTAKLRKKSEIYGREIPIVLLKNEDGVFLSIVQTDGFHLILGGSIMLGMPYFRGVRVKILVWDFGAKKSWNLSFFDNKR